MPTTSATSAAIATAAMTLTLTLRSSNEGRRLRSAAPVIALMRPTMRSSRPQRLKSLEVGHINRWAASCDQHCCIMQFCTGRTERVRRRYLILAICCMSLFIVGLDATIVNIALPSLRTDLNASVAGLQWTIDAYTLVLASLLVLSGSTADRIGRRRTFQTGLALFTAGSLLCSLAPGLGWLIAFRAVQAIGGSMLNPVA